MLDLHRLMLLREIKFRGSMSAAARNLSYSHSAVSQQMSLLEKEVGVVLLERVGRGVRLTDAAEQLVRHTESVLAILEEAESDLASALGEIRGSITIATFGTVARAIVPQALVRLRRMYPQLSVDFEQYEPEEGLARLAGRRLDLLIADQYPDSPMPVGAALDAQLIYRDPVAAYLPVGATAETVSDLELLPWVTEPRGTGSFAWVQQTCRSVGFEPDVRYQSADVLFHLRLVEAGLAAAFLPGLVVQESVAELHPSPLFPGTYARGIHAISREGSQNRPAITACKAAIRDVMTTVCGPDHPQSATPDL
ncbi:MULTISPECIES: LysR family transcriptional regulator [unclassified Streptomyces]|uniref:LysR family transcriptional regulator n=1 Tax=unclassified Streptomyces TaxID=2593676 RepID=UPI003426894B